MAETKIAITTSYSIVQATKNALSDPKSFSMPDYWIHGSSRRERLESIAILKKSGVKSTEIVKLLKVDIKFDRLILKIDKCNIYYTSNPEITEAEYLYLINLREQAMKIPDIMKATGWKRSLIVHYLSMADLYAPLRSSYKPEDAIKNTPLHESLRRDESQDSKCRRGERESLVTESDIDKARGIIDEFQKKRNRLPTYAEFRSRATIFLVSKIRKKWGIEGIFKGLGYDAPPKRRPKGYWLTSEGYQEAKMIMDRIVKEEQRQPGYHDLVKHIPHYYRLCIQKGMNVTEILEKLGFPKKTNGAQTEKIEERYK